MRKLILFGLIIVVLALWWLVAPKTHAQGSCIAMNKDGTLRIEDSSKCATPQSEMPEFSFNRDPSIGAVTEYMTCRKVFHDARGNIIARHGCKACKLSGNKWKCRRLYPHKYSHPGKKEDAVQLKNNRGNSNEFFGAASSSSMPAFRPLNGGHRNL